MNHNCHFKTVLILFLVLGAKCSPGFCAVSRFIHDCRPHGQEDPHSLYRIIGSCENSGNRKTYVPVEDHSQAISTRSNQKSDDLLLAANQAEITRNGKYANQLRFTFSGRKITFPAGKNFSYT